MRKRMIVVVAGAALAAAALGIAGALAGGGDGDGGKATTPAQKRAVAAALRITGGGTANAVERDSEDGATWEVEVTKPNGATVDVRLDAGYGLVVVDGDSEDQDGPDSDDVGQSG